MLTTNWVDRVFGWETKKSWEFTSANPARSYVPIWILYGIPMTFIQALLGEMRTVDPITVFYALRITFALGTWILGDMAIDRLSRSKQDRIKGLVFAATSYVTWTFQSHTFSNSIETIVLMWCLVIIHEFKYSKISVIGKHFDSALLAILITFGIFNRVTFPAFLVLPSIYLLEFFVKNPLTIVTFAMTGILSTLLAVSIDTALYQSQQGYVFAPLNNLLYNLNITNLSSHGLHPRFTHIFANIPQLIGPGAFFLFSKKHITSLPFLSAVSGLIILSIVPHQEARFLLPIVPLLCFCFDTSNLSQRTFKWLFGLWIVFNVFMGVIMGIYHQGGVVPCQSFISNQNLLQEGDIVVWWKTYSPPIWLLGKPIGSLKVMGPNDSEDKKYGHILEYLTEAEKSSEAIIIDLMGADENIVLDVLSVISDIVSAEDRNAYFVAPVASFDSSKIVTNIKVLEFDQIWSTAYHVTLESINLKDLKTMRPGLAIWKFRPVV